MSLLSTAVDANTINTIAPFTTFCTKIRKWKKLAVC